MVSTCVGAASRNATRIDTRYGIVDVVDHAGTVDIRFRGEVVRSIEALGASLYRVTPDGQREFVIVDAMTPGLHCRHVFVLVDISSDGEVIASNPFGACKEFKGVELRGEAPVIHLGEPDVPGRTNPLATMDFESRDGNIVQVSGQAATRPASDCAALAEAAGTGSSSIDSGERTYKVSGQGRLQFLSAPSPACHQPGIFVIPGDTVRASRRFDSYSYVQYVNPKSGKTARGWVTSSRLAEAPTPQN
jgi:hypothetical protein